MNVDRIADLEVFQVDPQAELDVLERARKRLNESLKAPEEQRTSAGRIAPDRRRRRTMAIIAFAAASISTAGIAAATSSPDSWIGETKAGLIEVFSSGSTEKPSDDGERRLKELDAVVLDGPLDTTVGPQVPPSTRVLLRYSKDGYSIDLSATKTTHDQLCYSAVVTMPIEGSAPAGADGCIESFLRGWPIEGTGSMSAMYPTIIYGVTSDDVKRVRFVTAKATHDAVMGTNAYFWVAPSLKEDPIYTEVELDDGRVLRRSSGVIEQRERVYGSED